MAFKVPVELCDEACPLPLVLMLLLARAQRSSHLRSRHVSR